MLTNIIPLLKTKIESKTGFKEALSSYNPENRSKMNLKDSLYGIKIGQAVTSAASNKRELITHTVTVVFSCFFKNEKADGEGIRQAKLINLYDTINSLAVSLKCCPRDIGAVVVDETSTELEFLENENTILLSLNIPIKYFKNL